MASSVANIRAVCAVVATALGCLSRPAHPHQRPHRGVLAKPWAGRRNKPSPGVIVQLRRAGFHSPTPGPENFFFPNGPPPQKKKKKKGAQPETAPKKTKRNVPNGVAHIQSTFNNTWSITDSAGEVISCVVGWCQGFKGARQSTPFAAQDGRRKPLDAVALGSGIAPDRGAVQGPGSGRETRSVPCRWRLEITLIRDVTPCRHNAAAVGVQAGAGLEFVVSIKAFGFTKPLGVPFPPPCRRASVSDRFERRSMRFADDRFPDRGVRDRALGPWSSGHPGVNALAACPDGWHGR